MSLLDDVLRESRSGVRPAVVAARLGVDVGLVEAAVDHWVRLGVMTEVADLGLSCHGCGSAEGGTAAGAAVSGGCAGCPVAGASTGSAEGQRGAGGRGPVPVRIGWRRGH